MMSEKNYTIEIAILQVAKCICYILSFIGAVGAIFPFAIAFLADVPETLAPIIRVIVLAIFSTLVLIFFGTKIEKIDSIIKIRKNQHDRELIQARIAAKKANRVKES